MTSIRRPNIVMILTDDHAAQSIGAYGSVINTTPRIDEIARHGWRFDNCFATNSLCSPSRASILTGTYSHVNGVTTLVTPLDARQPTFISQLKAAGYKTAMVGKWHMGDGPGHDPQGFDYWDVILGQGEYWNPRFRNPDGLRMVEGYATDVFTDLAIDWVESLDGDEPWCVLIYHKAPHRPWEPHPRHAGLYTDPIPVPRTFDDDYATRSSSVRRALMRLADNLTVDDLKVDPPSGLGYDDLALWKYQRYMEDYLRCVQAVDENVGRVIDWLRVRGDFDDTMLMYASDQGFFLGEHGWFDKRLMFEESLRMPLLLCYPRALDGGRVHDGIVTNVDFAQTILAARAGTTFDVWDVGLLAARSHGDLILGVDVSGDVLGLALPSPYSSLDSIEDAEQVARNLGLDFTILPITGLFETFLASLAPIFAGAKPDVTEQNLQARIRGNLLMAIANKQGRLLLSTGNKSENAVGYCTLYGDMSGGLAVIADVPKQLVYALCRHLNRDGEVIPWRTIEKPPSAELAPNQKDEDDLPPYPALDAILAAYLEEHRSIAEIVAMGFAQAVVEDVIRRIQVNEYKRKQAPLGLKVTTKAFGLGRRYPTAEGYREGLRP